jgi:hypothetical protein
MACEFRVFCTIGGGASCEGGFCDERERLELLKKEKCPVMIALKRTGEECDLPFWIRALIPHDTPCMQKDNCIIALCLPEIRSNACGDNPKLKLKDMSPQEITHLAAVIKQKTRRFISQPRTQTQAQVAAYA